MSRPCYFLWQPSSWLSGRHFGEPKLDAPNPARFIKSAKAHIAGFRRGVTLFQKVAHFRTVVEFVRDDQVTSLAAGDHSGRQVDGRAEEIQPVVCVYGQARSCMETGFQGQRNRAHIFRKFPIHVADCFQSFVHAAKASHDCIPNCLHYGSMVFADDLGKDVKMIPHQGISRRVPDTPVHRGRAAQIGEQDHLRADGDLLSGRDYLVSKKIAKFLPVRHARGRQDVLTPSDLVET